AGGLADTSTSTLTNVTVTLNTTNGVASVFEGGGIATIGGTVLANSIVAGNIAPGATPDDLSSQSPITANNTIIQDNTGFTVGTGTGNQLGVNPQLDPAGLQSNGGNVLTIALLPTSPAINQGNNGFITNATFLGPPFTDERGTGFNRIINNIVDIG